jgi:peptidyl-prolyl cis-trans isomerase D
MQAIGGAIVVGIIVVFVLEFRAGRGAVTGLKSECALEVFGRCITPKEFYAAYGLALPRGADPAGLRKLLLRQQVAEGLVERELLLKEADRLGISISDQQLEDELVSGRARVSLPVAVSEKLSFQLGLCRRQPATFGCEPGAEQMVRQLPVKSFETKQFDYKIYERIVRNTTNRSPREFKEMQKRELRAKRMRDLLRARVRVSEAEAFMLFERERSRVVLRSVELKRDWFAKYAVDTSDAAVKAWAAQNQGEVDSAWKEEQAKWKAGCYLVSEIFAQFSPETSDQDKLLSRDHIEQADKRIRGGDAFEEVARELSDASSATDGGARGCLSSDDPSTKALQDAASGLKPGKVSPIIETENGFYLIRLEGTLGSSAVEAVARRSISRRLAARFLAGELALKFATELIEKAQAGASLETATRELAERYLRRPEKPARASAKSAETKAPPELEVADRPKVEISTPFTLRDAPIPSAMPGEALTSKAFELDKPNAVHPVPLTTQDGWVVIQLKEKDPATRQEFAQHKGELVRRLEYVKAQDALARMLVRLRKQAEQKIVINPTYTAEPKGQGSSDEG